MSTRTVSVSLNANVSGFVSAMGRAGSSVEQVTSKVVAASQKTAESGRQITAVARTHQQEWDTVGSTLTKVGAVAAAGLGGAAKAAIDWESAFAGVKKTVDGSPQQIAALEGELRQMARTMAASHTDIAAVAEAAGQLGVQTENVAGFTRTMIMLGESTNMSAEQAATSLAQFMTIMGTAPDKVGNLGAALVGLGNNFATTESQILAMGQRIAGAGKAINLSEADVLGFAAAIASTGIEVEAGGTAISMAFLKMDGHVRASGKELDLLAKTAGMSSAEFKRAFETDAAGAINSFVVGLGKVGKSGGDVTAILKDLGITGIREADVLRRLALAGTLLGDAVGKSNDEITAGTALINEYGQRAATTESQVRVAWNNIVDAAITAGSVMLPAIAGIAQAVAKMATAFSDLPAPVRNGIVVLTAIVAAVGLFGGAAMKAIASVIALQGSVVTLAAALRAGGTAATVAGGQIRAGLIGIAAAGIGLAAVINLSQGLQKEIEKNAASIDQYGTALGRLGNGSKLAMSDLDFQVAKLGSTTAMAGRDIKGTSDLFRALRESSNVVAEGFKFIGDSLGMTSSLGVLRDEVDKLDQSLVKMRPAEAGKAFRQLADEMAQAGISVEDQVQLFDDYGQKITQLANDLGITLTPLELYKAMMGDMPPALAEAIAAQGGMESALAAVGGAAESATMSVQDYANAMLALSGSQIGVEQAIANANKALGENKRNIDLTTEGGRANVTALNQLASASMKYIETLAAQGAPMAEQEAATKRARGEFERLATAMGYAPAKAREMADAFFATQAPSQQAAEAARNFAVEAVAGSKAAQAIAAGLRGIPAETQIGVTMPNGEVIKGTVEEIQTKLQAIPVDKQISVTMPNGEVVKGTAAEVEAAIRQIQDEKTVALNADPSGAIAGKEAAQGSVDSFAGTTVSIGVDASPAIAGSNAAQAAVDNTHGKINIVGVDPAASQFGAAAAQLFVDNTHGKTNAVDVDASGAQRGASQAQGFINSIRNVTTKYIDVVSRYISIGGLPFADGGMITATMNQPAGPQWAGAQQLASGGAVAAQMLATGGRVAGFSPHPRADNVPIWATAGEVMMSNAAGDAYGRDRLLAINSKRVDPRAFAAFMDAQGFADGGRIGPRPTPTPPSSGGRQVHQEFHYHYPQGERESTATRRAASSAALAAVT